MADSVFRIVYQKPKPGETLWNGGIKEVSYNGERMACVNRGKFRFDADGIPLLTLELMVTDIEIDGKADVEMEWGNQRGLLQRRATGR